MPLALVVDDERSICESIAGVLNDEGWQVDSASSGTDGLRLFMNKSYDLVLLDVWMNGIDGIETLQRMKDYKSDVPIVIMSGHGTIETAVRATKLGAYQFLEKPLSLEKLLPILSDAVEKRSREDKSALIMEGKYAMVGQSVQMAQLKKQVRVVGPRNSWVLITGENGTGKENLARNIHSSSKRAAKPFVAVNCAAIPEELIESELFGFVKGAFTNALADRRGKFELAHQGTLFLDEIGDMSLKTQAKILRILQEQSFERVGGQETVHVDVRVIAATNKDLQKEIEVGNFREDLFYRLNVIPLSIPPLRARQEDALVLANHFLSNISNDLGEPKKNLTQAAAEILSSYYWPGNIRELRNLIERLCIFVEGNLIDDLDLPEHLRIKRDQDASNSGNITVDVVGKTLKDAREDFEKAFILWRLEACDWNVTKTAEAIGVERSSLHRKLRAYQIDAQRLKG